MHKHRLHLKERPKEVCKDCGVDVCRNVHPSLRGCNLEEGHSGPHTSTFAEDGKTWEDGFPTLAEALKAF